MRLYFTYDNANKIVEIYQYLIGKEIVEGFEAQYVCIVPSSEPQRAAFASNLNMNHNPGISLTLSGFDKGAVRIVLINQDQSKGMIYHYDLDKYLTNNKISKAYNSEGVFIDPKSI